MKHLVSIVGAAALVLVPSAAHAQVDWNRVATYQMNEQKGHVLNDSTHRIDGRIGRETVLNGRHLHMKVLPFKVYPTHPEHVSTVDSDRLNPGGGYFSVTWRMRVNRHLPTPNVMQKGQGSPPGGMFKIKTEAMKTDRSYTTVSCLFRGSIGDSFVTSIRNGIDYADDVWHTVTCRKFSGYNGRTTLIIDGELIDTNHKDPGVIANNWPLAIGGNTVCTSVDDHCNYWAGDLDYIHFNKARQRSVPSIGLARTR